MRFKSRSRALAASALAASLGLAGLTLAASPAQAVEDTEIVRVAGATRYGTASAAAATGFPDGATNVVLASGEKFPDALAAGGLAGTLDAPILLTPSASLDSETTAGLEELGAENVTIVGGTDAVSQDVEDALEAEGYTVDRVAGANRYETAGDIAAEVGGTTAVLANGLRFPDALAISPGAHALELPVLLTGADELSAEAAGYIDTASVDSVVIVGGTDVVSQDIEDGLEADGVTVTRLAGTNRYETAVEIAEFHLDNGFSADELVLATGEKFADALSGGPMASQLLAPMILTQTDTLTGVTGDFIEDVAPQADTIYILGGPAAVSEAVEDAAAAAAQAGTNQAFAVSPTENRSAEVGTVSQFSVSGITTSVVDIALVGCENITTTDGVTMFPNSSNPGGAGNVANLAGADAANDITVINGVAGNAGQYANNVTVVNGTVSFTVTNGAADCYVAVVFNDADNDNNLDLGTDNMPSEAFGNSGDVTVIPAEAGDNTTITGPVTSANLAGDFFVADGETYYYDSNDEFILVGTPNTTLTLEQFEARISTGDGITGNYRNTPANQSSFVLDDTAPAAPANVATKAPDGTNAGKPGLEVTWTESTTATVASYQVFRATATPPAITGQMTTCPAQTSGAYSQIGTVAADGDTTTGETVEYYDATATAPAAGQTQPQYCYYVVSVDVTGDTGPNSATTGPATAVTGDTSGAPEFTSASAESGGTTVVVNYDEDIKPASTDADASNYAVTVTRGAVTTALTEVSAADTGADTVTITVSGIPGGGFQAGDIIVVTAQNGADGNTVLDVTDVAQPVGDAVQTTAADTNPTVVAASVADNDSDGTLTTGDVVTIEFSEAMDTSAPADIDIAVSDGTDAAVLDDEGGSVDWVWLSPTVLEGTLTAGTVVDLPATMDHDGGDPLNTDLYDLEGNTVDFTTGDVTLEA